MPKGLHSRWHAPAVRQRPRGGDIATEARRPQLAKAQEPEIVRIKEGTVSTEIAPFGGMKESGIGREGSKYGIEEFIEVKYLCMGGIDR
jgi:acyl-CoA reductase-like NAD-dependent aldehyde dehydrogenase